MKKAKKLRVGDTHKLFYLFISPWLIGFCVFTFFPMLFSLLTSFTNWNGMSTPKWVGFENYISIFKADSLFHKSLSNTLFYVGLSVPLNLILSIVLAVLLNKRTWGTNFFRAVFYLPTICTGVASYITWLYLYNKDFGFINVVLNMMGIQGPGWLSDIHLSLLSIVLMDMFVCGTSMTVVLAALQDIPKMYYEAAELDGAGAVQQFMHVTFPMISPVVFFNLLMTLIKGLQIFTQPYVMTEGGPANSTYVYGIHLYKSAFLYTRFGYASALAWILFLILIGLSVCVFATSKYWVYYREDVN